MAQQMTPTISSSTTTVKGISSTNFTWVITNFSKLETKWLFSDVFVAGGYKWRLYVYPKGKKTGECLSVYLHASGSEELSSGWSIKVQFGLTLVNQVLRYKSIKKDGKCKFSEGKTDLGCPKFMPLKELYDPTKGYVVNDTVIIEADVSVESSLRVSKNEIAVKRIEVIQTPADGLASSSASDQSSPELKNEIAAKKTEVISTIPDNHSISLASPSMSGQSSYLLLDKSKNLLTELSFLKITRKPTSASSNGALESALQRQRKALKDYLALSLEDIDKANAFDEIEKITLLLIEYSVSSLERTILRDLVSRLASFKEIVPATKSSIENMRAEKTSLLGKKADVRARLYLGQEQLCSLEVKLSKLLEEERELEEEVVYLVTEEGEIHRTNFVALELEKMNEQVSKDIEEWKSMNMKAEEAANHWLEVREKLAQAQLSWQLFKQNLELCQKL